LRDSIVVALLGHASLGFGQVQAQAEAGDDHQTTGVRDHLPILPRVIAEIDRATCVARKVVFKLTADSA